MDSEPNTEGDVDRQEHGAPHITAYASGEAQVIQSGRDTHYYLSHRDSRARRTESEVIDTCPYPGLAPFGQGQARWFFGRDSLVADLVGQLAQCLSESCPMVVVAPSGAGKSSLLRAGLLPAIDRGSLPTDGARFWPRIYLTPTSKPVDSLASHLGEILGENPAVLAQRWAESPERCAMELREAMDSVTDASGDSRVIVVIDQFEDLFTLCQDDTERAVFVAALEGLLTSQPESNPAGLLVIGLRADAYSRSIELPMLRRALKHSQILVGPMSEQELREAINLPALEVGMEIEPELVEHLLRDLGVSTGTGGYEPGRLPLLAHALRATWQVRNGHTMTIEGYRTTGGIEHAIARSAEATFNQLAPGAQHLARSIFLQLVALDGDSTRRRVPVTELTDTGADPATGMAIVNAFVEARMLTSERDHITITHEALLRAWPRLHQWMSEDREGSLVRQRLHADATNWNKNGRPSDALYRGVRLESARPWVNDAASASTSPLAKRFVAASVNLDRRRKGARQVVITMLAVLALMASSSAVLALQQRSSAIQSRNTALSERNTAIDARNLAEADAIDDQADELRSSNPQLAAQLDLASYQLAPGFRSFANLVSDANIPSITTIQSNPYSRYSSVSYSPDGRILAVAASLTGNDGITNSSGGQCVVYLWSTSGGTSELLGHIADAQCQQVKFSPQGRILAMVGSSIQLWDLSNPKNPTMLGSEPIGMAWGLADSMSFSPDGSTLAIVQSGTSHGKFDIGSIQLWNVQNPRAISPIGPPLNYEPSGMAGVNFSPTGHVLADLQTAPIGSEGETTAQLWDVQNLAHPIKLGQPLIAGDDGISSLSFSPDGNVLATLAGEGENVFIQLWDISKPAHPSPLGKPIPVPGFMQVVTFNGNGQYLAAAGASSGASASALIWDVSNPARPQLTYQTTSSSACQSLNDMTFNPIGNALIFVCGGDGSGGALQMWTLHSPQLSGPASGIESLAFSPDGKTLAAIGAPSEHQGTVLQLWDMANLNDVTPLTLPGPPATPYVQFVSGNILLDSPGTLSSGAPQQTQFLQRWNLSTPNPKPLASITLPQDVSIATISPNAQIILSEDLGSSDLQSSGTSFTLWDLSNPSRPGRRGTFDIPSSLINANGFNIGPYFSPDGKYLAIVISAMDASDSMTNVLEIWDIQNLDHPMQLGRITSLLSGSDLVQFSPDSHMLAIAQGAGLASAPASDIQLWNITDPAKPELTVQSDLGPSGGFGSIAFNSDGSLIVTSGLYAASDAIFQLWDTKNLSLPVQLGQSYSNANGYSIQAQVSPDGGTLALAGPDGTINLWTLDIPTILKEVCAATSSAMTPTLWREYIPTIAYKQCHVA
jgi:WD40 repeat protein